MKLTRSLYAEMFGPTVGDQVRLADTELLIEVERDLIAEKGGYGGEVKFGGGKVIRDGMGQSPLATDEESLDLVITNALVLDAVQGVVKCDIGVKRGRIVGIATLRPSIALALPLIAYGSWGCTKIGDSPVFVCAFAHLRRTCGSSKAFRRNAPLGTSPFSQRLLQARAPRSDQTDRSDSLADLKGRTVPLP